MRISDWSSDVCSADLAVLQRLRPVLQEQGRARGDRHRLPQARGGRRAVDGRVLRCAAGRPAAGRNRAGAAPRLPLRTRQPARPAVRAALQRRHPGGAEGALTTTKESPMHRQVPDSDLEYELVSFDKHGKEREESGALPSDALTARLAQRDAPVTDMFLLSHGWKDRKSTRLNSSH